MRMALLSLAIAGCVAASPVLGRDDGASAEGGRDVYIVHFNEPALALFRGDTDGGVPASARLKATAPGVTGARQLDVDAPAARSYRGFLAQQRGTRLAMAERALGRPLKPGFVYDVVANAVSLELSEAEARQLAKLPGVRRVSRDFARRLMSDAGPRWIGADRLWDGSLGASTRGAGIVVGVIDTGINRTHPSFAERGPVDGFNHTNPLSRQFGLCATQPGLCNNKLIGIYDFSICTGVHASSRCTNRETDDGRDVDGHGSHVASTAVGNVLNVSFNLPTGTVQRQLSGVAPHASLISYKACEKPQSSEETGSCRGTWLLAALNQAAADRVQVLNYSIGGTGDSPWSCFGVDCNSNSNSSDIDDDAEAMFALREAGTVVVVAAGNDGPASGSITRPAYAPWVLAVANTSHDRVIANRLVDLSGGATPPPAGGVLVGAGLTTGLGPVALVAPNDFPLCSQGTDLDSPPTGASNPWSAGRFNGEIVVCLRGVQARVAKSNNVRLAGGSGMVLVNQASDGEGIVADSHSIPATHLGFADGQALLNWLRTGSGHRGRLEGASVSSAPERADVLSSSSGRGPTGYGDYLKPDIAAPGSSVQAAAGTGSGFAFLSGTSMATPHVAGAAALLRAAKPNWNVSDIESALRSSALPVVRLPDGSTPATAFDQGSGRIDVAAALRAGLSFPLTPNELRNANPNAGGNPKALNLPSLVDAQCLERCSFTRRVTDLVGGGTWRAEFSGPPGMQVTITPAEFSLTAGGSRELQFSVDVSDSRLLGRWAEGRVLLRRQAGSLPAATVSDTTLPVRVFSSPGSLPAKINLSGPGERGFNDVALNGLVALDDLRVAATALVAPVVTIQSKPQDPSTESPYTDIGVGSFFTLVDVPALAAGQRYRLRADATSATAVNVDLFVGRDDDGDGQPDSDEERCTSTSPSAREQCLVEINGPAAATRYWALIQNWRASSTGAINSMRLDTALIDLAASNAGGLVATGPARTGRLAPFSLRLAWDDLTLQPGETRFGYLRLAAAGGANELGLVPVELTRTGTPSNAAKVLAPGSTTRLRLAPGQAQDRLIVELPGNASELLLRSRGSGEVDLYLARTDSTGGPAIAAAPARTAALASARQPGANEELRLSGAALGAGRWYLTPVNSGATSADIELDLAVSFAGVRAQPRVGAYFNPERSGAGAFLYDAGPNWGFLWYTYAEDGSPVWYIGAAPRPGASQGVWNVDLSRFTWNGSSAHGTVVGNATLTLLAADAVQFAWNLDGRSGSERYVYLDGGGCARSGGTPFDINGFWFNPAQSGYGYSVFAFPGGETNGAYFYDAEGRGRWAIAAAAPFGTSQLQFDLRRGACPSCNYVEPTVTPGIGRVIRSYDDERSGRMDVDLALPAPLSGRWQVNTAVQKLSDPTGCR